MEDLISKIIKTKPNLLESSEDYEFSILYECSNDVQVAIEQIKCLYYLLLENTKEKFEIICIIPNKSLNHFKNIENLKLNLPISITSYYSDYFGNENFIHAGIRSKGKYIINSKYLIYFIDSLSNLLTNNIYFISPNIKYNKYFLEIGIISKSSLILLFRNLHYINFGFSSEILLLCEKFKIKNNIKILNLGKIKISFLNLIFNKIFNKFINFSYKKNFYNVSKMIS